jgi:hypothetical protein
LRPATSTAAQKSLAFQPERRDPVTEPNPRWRSALMHQIRIFKGLESNLPALEKEVNHWLAESKARVVQIFGNLAAQSGARHEGNSLAAYPYVASDVMLVVVFEAP